MPDQTIEEREGTTRYYLKGDASSSFILSRADYEPMVYAWQKGEAFYVAKDKVGDPCVIKLSDVHLIGLCSPEGLERFKEDQKIERDQKKARKITGEDDDDDD